MGGVHRKGCRAHDLGRIIGGGRAEIVHVDGVRVWRHGDRKRRGAKFSVAVRALAAGFYLAYDLPALHNIYVDGEQPGIVDAENRVLGARCKFEARPAAAADVTHGNGRRELPPAAVLHGIANAVNRRGRMRVSSACPTMPLLAAVAGTAILISNRQVATSTGLCCTPFPLFEFPQTASRVTSCVGQVGWYRALDPFA